MDLTRRGLFGMLAALPFFGRAKALPQAPMPKTIVITQRFHDVVPDEIYRRFKADLDALGPLQPEISPGWQARRAALAETIRTCEHSGERLTNADGKPFCADCGRHLDVA